MARTRSRLLVVDDEPDILSLLEASLQSDRLAVLTAATAGQGIDLVRREHPDAVLLDVRLPDLSGLDALEQIHAIDPRLPVILITGYGEADIVIEAAKRGAYEYLLKPLNCDKLRELVEQAIDRRARARRRTAEALPAPAHQDEPAKGASDGMVGRSAAMLELYKAIGRVAPQDVTVLLLGETGTGKELAAQAIHRHSRRSGKPFVAINCAAIPETLLESELFGHERGAFTTAIAQHKGRFERADGGTLFLDEVGDIPASMQVKLLRVLQERRFERVGGSDTIQADMRLIAATNQDLETLVARGHFRQDLFHRLNVVALHVPPLRQRHGDVPLLVEHFLQVFNRDFGKQVHHVGAATMSQLGEYPWPGNVRELEHVIQNALLLATDDILTSACLPERVQRKRRAGVTEAPDLAEYVEGLLRDGQTEIYAKVSALVDRVVLPRVLAQTEGNQARASKLLGLSRTTLWTKLRHVNPATGKQFGPETRQTVQNLLR
jgi:two-component system nitrogen regulation response regulator GlnG